MVGELFGTSQLEAEVGTGERRHEKQAGKQNNFESNSCLLSNRQTIVCPRFTKPSRFPQNTLQLISEMTVLLLSAYRMDQKEFRLSENI